MSNDGIWLVGGDGALVPMEPSMPRKEDDLQSLIARHREVIAGDGEALLLVRREQGISGNEDGGDRWSLDHLFVTREAVPVLVEVKRASDTRIRREVVAQMLDYAANGVRYWLAGAARASFERTCQKEGVDPDEHLAAFLGAETEETAAAFWEDMEKNLHDGRLKMLFVADRVPDELATIVEFLNQHTQDYIEVRAVELRHFAGGDGLLTLVRRVVGETAQSKLRKKVVPASKRQPIMDPEAWLAENWTNQPSTSLAAGKEVIRFLRNSGAIFEQRKDDLAPVFQTENGKKFRPMSLARDGRIYLGTHLVFNPGSMREPVREVYVSAVERAIGERFLHENRLTGWASFETARLAEPSALKAYLSAMRDWIDACQVIVPEA